MLRRFANGGVLWLCSLALRAPRRRALLFALTVSALPWPNVLCATVETSSSVTSDNRSTAESYAAILNRVQTEPLLDENDPRFSPGLIMGSRKGGILMFCVGFHDPMNPSILSEDFANWNWGARANLLLSYARLVTGSVTPPTYVGIPDDEIRSLVAADAEERARIRRVVLAGGYGDSWKPFVVAYQQLAAATEKMLPPGDTPRTDLVSAVRIADLAREQGMYKLIRGVPIEPNDVANELLRVLQDSRRRLGGTSTASDQGPNLLYSCGGNPLTVHIHSWHNLAPALFRAADAAEGKNADPQAMLIMTMLDGLRNDINAWVLAHPDALPVVRDRKLDELAMSRGLYALLGK